MRKFTYILAISVFCVLNSCNNEFLNTDPSTEFSENAVWTDPALVETYINNIYFRLDEPLTDGRFKANITDEAHYRGNAPSLNFNRSIQSPDALLGWTYSRYRSWEDQYKSIRYCNIFFSKIDEVPFGGSGTGGTTLKDRMSGEVHFLRAFHYFNLVSTYGGVPLITKVYELKDEFSKERDSFEECIKFIAEELDKASQLLPLTHTGNNVGRATKGAALALKSRVLLYAASDLYNTNIFPNFDKQQLVRNVNGSQTQRWQEAKKAAKDVIDLNNYRLHKASPAPSDSIAQNLTEIFLSKNTEEDIFVKYFTTPMQQRVGLYSNPNGYHGWGTNAPLGDLVDAYERRDGSKFDWNNSIHAANPYLNRDPRFYATILHNGAGWRARPEDAKGLDPNNKIQTGKWERWSSSENKMVLSYGVDTRQSTIEDWNGSYTGYYLRKYIDPAIDAQYVRQAVTWRFIRYAEVLMNYAEACIELGEYDEAKAYLNLIRKRSGMPNIEETGNALRNRYRNERLVEFAFEEHRFYDIRRWAIGPAVYNRVTKVADIVYKMNEDKTTATIPAIKHIDFERYAWNDKSYFLPILRDEINKNTAIVQNPGY